MQFEEYAVKLNAGDFASRSKAKAKPQRFCQLIHKNYTKKERTWTDVEPGKYSLNDYPVSKKLIYLLRHESLLRDNDGAIEFWRVEDYLQDHFVFCHHWSDEKWKSAMAGGGGHLQEQFFPSEFSKVIQDANLIDPSLQDNVVIPDGFFKYIYHVGCAMNSRSIINSGLIPGGQNLGNRQTVFFLLVGSYGQRTQGS